MSNRNRSAGHSWERDCVKALKVIFPNIATARSCNRKRDSEKVDLVNEDELIAGRLPYNFQCKCLLGNADLETVLKEIPEVSGIPGIVLHRRTRRTKTSTGKTVFKISGEYAFMEMSTLVKLLQQINPEK